MPGTCQTGRNARHCFWCLDLTIVTCLLMAGISVWHVPLLAGAELKPETIRAFEQYAQATEARIEKELARPGAFLHAQGLPEPWRGIVWDRLQRGEVHVGRLKTLDATDHVMRAPGGLIHHWIGAVFVPGATLRQALDVVQDYDRHQETYTPEVARSKLLQRDGNDFKVLYRLRRKSIITVVFNAEYNIKYFPVDAKHCHSRCRSTRIAEVADADKPDEHEKPVGDDRGLMWRHYSYWRFEERSNGTYIECETVTLTRDLPPGTIVESPSPDADIHAKSLRTMLASTRAAVLARVAAAHRL